jgi:HK97 family phage major capsid protein
MTHIRVPAGTFTEQLLCAGAACRGDWLAAEQYAMAKTWGAAAVCKALIDPLTADTALNNGMVNIGADFAEYLRPLSVLGRMNSVRRLPFDTRTLLGTGGTSGRFIAENAPIPFSAQAFDDADVLRRLKVGAGIVVTDESVRASVPGSQPAIVRDLGASLAEAEDRQLLDPSAAGTADVSPASITYGVTPIASSGLTVGAMDIDLERALKSLTAAQMPLTSATWVMHPETAAGMSLMRDDGAPAYPGLSPRGGTLLGLPVITSSVCASGASPLEKFIVLVEQQEIVVADDSEYEFSISKYAAVQLDDAPAGGAQTLTTLWQHGMTGVIGQHRVNWRVRRPGAVAIITDVLV